MKATVELKTRATKLRQVLGDHGHQLKHSESLEVISKIDGYSDWNTCVAGIGAKRKIAEQFLDEMLEAAIELNYEKFTKSREQEYLVKFTKRHFERAARDIREDCGSFISREYLGATNELLTDKEEGFPNSTKHIWRGVFEKGEVVIILNIYHKEGTYYVRRLNFR